MWIAKLKSLKNKCKVTYMEISIVCKVPESRVSKWFNGVAVPETVYIDIMHNKFFSEVVAVDNFERYFQFAYEEKHNIDGQIGMYEVNEEHLDLLMQELIDIKADMDHINSELRNEIATLREENRKIDKEEFESWDDCPTCGNSVWTEMSNNLRMCNVCGSISVIPPSGGN